MQDTEPVTRPISEIINEAPDLRRSHGQKLARRTAPFSEEPGYYEPARLWLYGNVRLFHSSLAYVTSALGVSDCSQDMLKEIEAEAERLVLDGKVLVCGIHNDAHRRSAVVPLRWGSPRIVVVSGGFKFHLGVDLEQEPFRAARLWRYKWDRLTDLIVSRRAPDKKPTFACSNPTVDRLIEKLARNEWTGLRSRTDPLTSLLT